MSYEAWGDDDGGPEGYVTDERAAEMVAEATAELRAENERLKGKWKEAGDRCPQCGTGIALARTEEQEPWIPLAERLPVPADPPAHQRVLCSTSEGLVGCEYVRNLLRIPPGYWTHWKPMPQGVESPLERKS